ncbi:uncharacterized protein LOC106651971 [Trichogramma pretiosum]|uniref:uncharacterized protein LOC106651971 n=1 Tax=Trichogramma pretiosum TaxID=7493 RepID=UPI0006C9B429|nr:uncharacterized protein LOC106651971 [Trichogramma pretiosum]
MKSLVLLVLLLVMWFKVASGLRRIHYEGNQKPHHPNLESVIEMFNENNFDLSQDQIKFWYQWEHENKRELKLIVIDMLLTIYQQIKNAESSNKSNDEEQSIFYYDYVKKQFQEKESKLLSKNEIVENQIGFVK